MREEKASSSQHPQMYFGLDGIHYQDHLKQIRREAATRYRRKLKELAELRREIDELRVVLGAPPRDTVHSQGLSREQPAPAVMEPSAVEDVKPKIGGEKT